MDEAAPRKPAKWMRTVDDRILEHLAETDWASPRTMVMEPAFDGCSISQLSERCKLLRHAELVDVLVDDSEMYQITGPGRRYLEGEYNVSWFDFPESLRWEMYSYLPE